jgi:hypothetical protein
MRRGIYQRGEAWLGEGVADIKKRADEYVSALVGVLIGVIA